MGSNSEPSLLDLLAERRLSHDFRWASRTWTGPPYFVRGQMKKPKEIILAVLESKNVQKVIQEVAKDSQKDEEIVKKQALDILSELAHDFHMYAIRWFGLVLSKLGKRLYNSIQVNTEKIEDVKKAYASYPVLLLPTHRSYVDFLLVSYMSFAFELTLPIIAAGMDFKGMVGVGEILRKSGAFYIRRRFGGDALYWALISEYVKKAVMEGGHPLEMFVEGTRSRSGKSLKPKVGLLSIVSELVTSGQIPDVLILPISMSYDRTLEERLYAHELLGKPKPKESTNGLMKALKWLGDQSYGSVFVNFGDLISIRQMIEMSSNPITLERPKVFLKSIEEIALKVVLDQQANLVVPLFAGISLIILSKISTRRIRIPLQELIESMEYLQRIITSRNSTFGFSLLGESLGANIRYILSVHSSLVSLSENDDLVLINFETGDTVQYMVFQHYANQILHHILPFSIILSLFTTHLHESEDLDEPSCPLLEKLENSLEEIVISPQIEEDYVFLKEIFQEDFLYNVGTELQELHWVVNTLKSMKLPGEELFLILRQALKPYLIAYWGVTRKLLEISRENCKNLVELKELGKQCQAYLQRQMKCGLVGEFGALSLETIANGISSLIKSQAVERTKTEDGSFGIIVRDSAALSNISSRLERLMGVESWISGSNKEQDYVNSNQILLVSKL